MSLLRTVCLSAALFPWVAAYAPGTVADERFELWSVTGTWTTQTNGSGWVLGNGRVDDATWYAPYEGGFAGWLNSYGGSGPTTWLRSPLLLNGAGTLSFRAANYVASGENTLAVQISTNGQQWTTVASIVNPVGDAHIWAEHSQSINRTVPLYLRLLKTGQTGRFQALGLDAVTVTAPDPLTLGNLRHTPDVPTSDDAIHVLIDVHPLLPVASNVTTTLHYRFDETGPYVTRPMTHLSNETYQTTTPIPAGHPPSTAEYYVVATVDEVGSVITEPKLGPGAPATLSIVSGETPSSTLRQFGPSSRGTPLTISEIMYHPGGTGDGTDREFVEIRNTDPVAVDISGYRLSGDIDYVFPEETVLDGWAALVVARDAAAIAETHPVSYILGPYSNRLSDSGGTLRLRNRQDAVLLEVDYSDDRPWPVAADGAGHSLVLSCPDYGEGNRHAWSASARIGGSPGLIDEPIDDDLSRVVINEFLAHTDLPLTDYIELHNAGGRSVDLTGCVLSDTTVTNKYVFPSNSIIGANGFLVLYQDTLGFSLDPAGDDIYLIETNTPRVLDAVKFPAQVRSVTSGRLPDGGPELRVLAARTPGAPNSGLWEQPIVINEIMFHPISGDEDDTYVELYNRSTGTVDLSHWRFTAGISYTFPAGVTLAAGETLVVARNATRLIANYPQLSAANTLGDFGGRLSWRGERLVLSRPDDLDLPNMDFVVVDVVEYDDGWGQWTDGGGSSLELIDPRSDNRRAMNWAGSDETGKAAWTMIETTAEVRPAVESISTPGTVIVDECHVYALFAGEYLVDNVLVRDASGSVLASGDFESGFGMWSAIGTHETSSIATGEGYGGSSALRVRATDPGDTIFADDQRPPPYSNRAETTLSRAVATGETVTLQARVRWQAGYPLLMCALKAFSLEAPPELDLPTNLGSPGQPNSRFVANAGPTIEDLAHTPVFPGPADSVLVTCRIADSDGIAMARMHYRIDPATTYQAVELKDDGQTGDRLSGDGIYSARLTPQASGSLLAYYMEASDNHAAQSIRRYPHDAPRRECLIRFGETPDVGEIPTYRIWMTASNVTEWTTRDQHNNTALDATLVIGNHRVIYNGGARYRGNWRGFLGPETSDPCGFVLTVPKSRRLCGETEIKLDMPGQNAADAYLQREVIGYALGHRVGLPMSRARYVMVRMNQRYKGVLYDFQTPATAFAGMWYPDDPDPRVWRIVHDDGLGMYTDAAGEKYESRYRASMEPRRTNVPGENFDSIYTLADALNQPDNATYEAQTRAVIDVSRWLGMAAFNHVIINSDAFGYRFRHNAYLYTPDGGRATPFVYDLDNGFSANDNTSQDPLSGLDAYAVRMVAYAPFRRVYWRALKAFAETGLAPDHVNPQLDAWYEVFMANDVRRFNGNAPTDPAWLKNWLAARRAYLLGRLPEVEAAFAITSHGGLDFTTNKPIVIVEGTAPIDVDSMHLNGRPASVNFTDVTKWSMQVPLEPGANALRFEGLDADGHSLAQQTVTITLTVAPPSPFNHLLINEIQYNPAAGQAEFVEIFNRSAIHTFSLGGMRLEGVGLDFPFGTFIGPTGYVVVAESLPAYAATYGNVDAVVAEYPGSLDNAGETLRLLMPSGTNWIVIDEVTYSPNPPWPRQADGSGPSLQLIDPERDNDRVGNWAAVALTNTLDWSLVAVTADTPVEGLSDTELHLYLTAAGEVAVDDVRLVEGTVPGVGSNLVRNGGFEIPLTDTWTPSGNHADSQITTNPVYRGNGALDVVSTGRGDPEFRIPLSVYQHLPALRTSTTYTLSFRYYPTRDENHELRGIVLDSAIGVSAQTLYKDTPPTLYTPGAPNTMSTRLPPFPDLWINEVMPSNTGFNVDNAGEFDPWIELYNAGDSMIDLGAGFYLSNSYDVPGLWAFPAGVTVGAGERLLIWADRQEHQQEAGVPHAGFRLSSTDGSVLLARRFVDSVQVLDFLDYALIPINRSFGSFPEGDTRSRLVFHDPTPGAPNSPTSQVVCVVINEWMSDNDRFVSDPADDQYEDWFELYNAGDQTVYLGGYGVSDDPMNPNLSVIPGGFRIPSKGYLRVWADGDLDQSNPEADLHVGFGLNKDGDTILLTAPDGTVVDRVDFGAQDTDRADGCWRDGQRRPVAMTPPTPGLSNRAFAIVHLVEGTNGITVTWFSEVDRVYQLNGKTTLNGTNWHRVGVVTALTSTATCIDTNTPPVARSFYRLHRRD